MIFSNTKYKNENAYIDAFKNFLKTGILPLFFFLFLFLFLFSGCTDNKDSLLPDTTRLIRLLEVGCQTNKMLIDSLNDEKLMTMDTTLYFGDIKILYVVTIKHEKVEVQTGNWKYIANDEYGTSEELLNSTYKGYQNNGFVFTNFPSLSYKVLLGRGLFAWTGKNWFLINAE
ncbi:hypothetical protein FACS1894180_4570 [Bacteroidia bacterium]|nr:hypothetical protein FACS1894180_4570 [Bacteroidia bacterium]